MFYSFEPVLTFNGLFVIEMLKCTNYSKWGRTGELNIFFFDLLLNTRPIKPTTLFVDFITMNNADQAINRFR